MAWRLLNKFFLFKVAHLKPKPAHLLTLLRSHVFHVLSCFFCRAGTAIPVKTILLWWQHLAHKANWIWPWCILLYVSLHIISLPSILHGCDVLTCLASWILGRYLVIYVCNLIINYASNQSSMITSTKICSSVICFIACLFSHMQRAAETLFLTPASSFHV